LADAPSLIPVSLSTLKSLARPNLLARLFLFYRATVNGVLLSPPTDPHAGTCPVALPKYCGAHSINSHISLSVGLLHVAGFIARNLKPAMVDRREQTVTSPEAQEMSLGPPRGTPT
jgi:hypothetical protein